MEQFKSLLVGVDVDEAGKLTQGTQAAIRQGLWLSGRTGAKVEYLHSCYRNPEEVRCAAVDKNGIEALLRDAGAGPELILDEERPWVAMSRRVIAGQNDLVLVAKRNHSRFTDRRLGSVSINLVRKCPAPVWVVRPDHESTHRCIVAATDLSEVGNRAVEYGAFVAKANECELVVAHAWQIPIELQMSGAMLGDEEFAARKQAIADAALSHIHAIEQVRELRENARVYLSNDSPSHALLELEKKVNADLMVMGTISRGGIPGLVVGNTAEKLLYQLDCSILTVKPDDFVSSLED